MQKAGLTQATIITNTTSNTSNMRAFYLGKREYKQVLRLQEAIFNAKIKRQVSIQRGEIQRPLIPDVTLLVEHTSPVYTLGRRDTSTGLPQQCDIEVVKTRRGGGITYHGPGQLTVYPIANIQHLWRTCTAQKVRSPIEWFSWVLEQTMIDTASLYSIPTHRYKTGVWADAFEGVPARKLGAIGLQLGNWVSMHGAGFNVSVDLAHFDCVVMCELPGEAATSVHQELELRESPPIQLPTVAEIVPALYERFRENLSQPSEVGSTVVDLSHDSGWHECVVSVIEEQ